MTTCFLAPDPIQSTNFIPGTNTPANGAQMFFYVAGTSTKQTVYHDPAAAVAWTNPIVLDSGGNIPLGGEVWFPQGESFKVVYAPSNDTDPPTSPYWTKDNLSGQNDVTGAQSEWVAGPTPTFISGTSFSVVGDQRTILSVGRRTKTTNTAGTIYSTITASTFSTVTTVTVVNDTGALDAGLSDLSYGLISAVNTSEPISHGMIAFTTAVGLTTTWTSPAAKAYVSASGGGGGGGGGNASGAGIAGAGGGAGEFVIKKSITVIPQTIYTIVIGAGGAAGNVGPGSTGASTFMSSAATGVVISLGGGSGGSTATSTSPTMLQGGSSFTPGSWGGWALTCSTVGGPIVSGGGGSTPWGPGPPAIWGSLGSAGVVINAAGANGANGSGGSGACNPTNGANMGGAGGAGIFIIEW